MPGMGKLDNALRWGFIKKVYGIMSTQLALTALVAAGSSYLMFSCPPSEADPTACELLTGTAPSFQRLHTHCLFVWAHTSFFARSYHVQRASAAIRDGEHGVPDHICNPASSR